RHFGVNPYAETVLKVDTRHSLKVSRHYPPLGRQSMSAEEAETSAAGGQLVKEYSVETHSGDATGGRQRSPASLRMSIIGVDLLMPQKTHPGCRPGTRVHRCLESIRRQISQRRMQSSPVIVVVNKGAAV